MIWGFLGKLFLTTCLEKSFLVQIIYNFSRNPRKTQRKLKKYYPAFLLPEIVEKPESRGAVFESILVRNLQVEFFWRDSSQHEVDIILVRDNHLLPLEIKYGKGDVGSLPLFMKKFQVNEGVVLTYDQQERQEFPFGTIKVIPFYEYLLRDHDEQR